MHTAGHDAKYLGIIMLNTRFPRLLGDIGNPESFSYPVRYLTVPNATVDTVVSAEGPDRALLAPFEAAIDELVDAGCAAIGTSCGFLAPFQEHLGSYSPVPFLSSSLLQAERVQRSLPVDQRVGIMTFDAKRLGAPHLEAANVPPGSPVVGLEGGRELHRVIQSDLPSLDQDAAQDDVLTAGKTLVSRHTNIGAIVLECTNLGPYKHALSQSAGLPVYDVIDMLGEAMGNL